MCQKEAPVSIPGHNDPRDLIDWDSSPPPGRAKHVPLMRPVVGQPITSVAIANGVQGCWQHHDGQNTVPCIGEQRGCRMCAQQVRRRRYWYLTVMQPGTGKIALLCITEGAYQACPHLQQKNVSIRGHYVKTWRTGKAINGPQHVQVLQHCGTMNLPPDIDVKGQLMHIWGIGRASDML